MEGITIFTPTYNRAGKLLALYKSLLKQSYNRFEWLIVDDGSSDNTRVLIEKFIKENRIDINYIYQDNFGKHVAFNTGVANAKYDLFMCIDSDDYLVDDILVRIASIWKEVKNNKDCKNVCGLLAHRGKNPKETMFGEKFINPSTYSTVKNEMKNGFFETTMIHLTDVLKKYPFPTFEGEKFLTEDIVWRQIDVNYQYFIVPEVWTICEYLPDGLTKTIDIFKYPKGEAAYFKIRFNTSEGIVEKLKEYSKYCVFSNVPLDSALGMLFYIPANILAIIYKFKWKLKFRR